MDRTITFTIDFASPVFKLFKFVIAIFDSNFFASLTN